MTKFCNSVPPTLNSGATRRPPHSRPAQTPSFHLPAQSPCLVANPQFHIPLPHVLHTWPPSKSNLWKRATRTPAVPPLLMHLLATYSHIHACVRLPAHAAAAAAAALVLTQNKETNILHPCLARPAPPVLPALPERMASTRQHTHMHACIHAEHNTRSFTCISVLTGQEFSPSPDCRPSCDSVRRDQQSTTKKRAPASPTPSPSPALRTIVTLQILH